MKGSGWLLVFCAIGVASTITQAQEGFPFDSELILEADPMPGSKRIPNIEISANGAMVLEMWCDRIEGQLVVAADTVTVLTGTSTQRGCDQARQRADSELLAALRDITNWRRDGDMLMLVGPRPLQFRSPSN